MAYENMTYEVILSRMMDRVTAQYPNLDTREGSILFNALAPAAVELAIMYTELDNAINESFVDTASREYILKACEQIGMDISSFDASYGVHKGEFDVEIQLGTRWNCDLYNYVVTEAIGLNESTGFYEYRMTCETAGTAPNNQKGTLIPINDVGKVEHAELTECLIEGENENTDDEMRDAYYAYVNGLVTDGNVAQYKIWCDNYDGVGNYKIFPLWNGANTVKVSILSASNGPASDELIQDFQNYLDPNIEGMGNGIAPIGAFVTVSTATEVPINVTADVMLSDGYADATIIDDKLRDYLSEIAYKKKIVAYMNIGAEILKTPGVEFVNNLLVNGGTSDVILGDEEIPTLGTTQWTVS